MRASMSLERGLIPLAVQTSVIGLGAGGHAAVLIEALRLTGRYQFVGLLDPQPYTSGTNVPRCLHNRE